MGRETIERVSDSSPAGRHWPASALSSIHELSLRAFDLSERTGRLGLASQKRRVERWRQRLFMILQISLAAGVSWFLGQHLLHHPMPFFAVVASIISLGLSFGQRISRVLEITVGVALGVAFGDAFVYFFGTGVWQIMLVVFVAMSVATWIGARNLMINQAGIQAATVMALFPNPQAGVSRWMDAVLGCTIALVFALVAPTSPIQKPRIKAAEVLADAASTLHLASSALAQGDEELARQVLERARSAESALSSLRQGANEGMAVVRYSPFLRGHRENAQALVDLVAPLDRLLRNLRVLARRVSVVAWRAESAPPELLDLLDRTGDVVDFAAAEMFARRMPDRARDRVLEVAEESSRMAFADASLSPIVILAQVRSILVDLLELTGLDYAEARALVPDMH